MAGLPLNRRWILVIFLASSALFVFYIHVPSTSIVVPSFPQIHLPYSGSSHKSGIDTSRPAAIHNSHGNAPSSNDATVHGDHNPYSYDDANMPDSFHGVSSSEDAAYPPSHPYSSSAKHPLSPQLAGAKWSDFKPLHPVQSYIQLPSEPGVARPRIQHAFSQRQSPAERKVQVIRLDEIKEAFKHSWAAYHKYAWGHDELVPISATYSDVFGGWAATLVDSLDTLWIMGLLKEFEEAVQVVALLDFSTSAVGLINVFETTIRYLGGLLSAYDLSGSDVLLEKAIELGDLLYHSFDTKNGIPNTRWDWERALAGQEIEPGLNVVSSELGSMTLEFTRLTQLTGDAKYYDAIARVTKQLAAAQDRTALPGLWPTFLNPLHDDLWSGRSFGLGAMADSLYEYLPKTWAILGGREDVYRSMYAKALAAAKEQLFYRPLNPWKPGELLAVGERTSDEAGNGVFEPRMQHLTCFAGGMVALGAKLFSNPNDMVVARQLTDGCIWSYNSTATKIAPEIFAHVACDDSDPDDDCSWSDNRWHAVLAGAASRGSIRYVQGVGNTTVYPKTYSSSTLVEGADIAARNAIPKGFYDIPDRKYQLRPEALESVFILYRTTGDPELREQGWAMFEAIARTTRVEEGFAGFEDVTEPSSARRDRMESFWTAETLKYAWLLFADEDQISLDDWVFNTEAHPLKLSPSSSSQVNAATPPKTSPATDISS